MKCRISFGWTSWIIGVNWENIILSKDRYHVFCIHLPTVSLIITWTEIVIEDGELRNNG